MHLGADLPEPMMYHGGPKSSASHSHEEPTTPKRALDVVVELNGEWHGKQVTSGAADQNTGSTVICLSPGLRLSCDNWSSYVSIGIPVINEPLYGAIFVKGVPQGSYQFSVPVIFCEPGQPRSFAHPDRWCTFSSGPFSGPFL